jgi:uncharacterized protein YoxC
MSDFFRQDLDNALNPPAPVAPTDPQLIKLGDVEYTQDQLNELVKLGGIAKELEDKWDTKIDKVYPKYTQVSTRVKELEQENETLRQKPTQVLPQDGDISPEDKEQAKRAARRLDILTKDDLAELGFVSKNDFKQYYTEQRETERLLDRMNGMQKDIDGKDGRPAFKTSEVLDYMAENRLQNPEIAYKLMNEDKLDAWKEKRIAEVKKPGLVTESSSAVGVKTPPEVRITRENRDELLKAALRGE